MRFNSRPFEGLNSFIFAERTKAMLQRAEDRLQKRLVNTDRLLYNYSKGAILDAVTGKYFTGKFVIPSDKFERIIKVINGQYVTSLVRFKTGEKYYAEILGNQPKYFKTQLSDGVAQEQIQKMLEADNAVFQKMADRFEAKVGRTE